MTRLLLLFAGMVAGSAATAVALGGQASRPADAVTVSPQLYTVKLDNPRVRVLEYSLAPGQVEPMHSHGSFVVRFLGDARIRATTPDGQSTESAVARGDVGWRDPFAHTVQNVGKTPVEAVLVEVKPCGK